MEAFFAVNPGLPSRIPHQLQFDDYSEAELGAIFRKCVSDQFTNGQMSMEDGPGGLYVRVAVRRVGRTRGREGFGNARDISNLLAKIMQRQSRRLVLERSQGLLPDDFTFTKEDLIGPDPSHAVVHSDAWKELNGLIGLSEVKSAVQGLVDLIATNYQRGKLL